MDEEQDHQMTRHDIEELFENLGFDVSTAKGRAEARSQIEFLRFWRGFATTSFRGMALAAVSSIAAGAMLIFGEGIKSWFIQIMK